MQKPSASAGFSINFPLIGQLNWYRWKYYLYLINNTMSTHQPTIFNQIFSLIKHEISPLIGQLDQHARKFDIQSLFKVLMFAQSTGRQSLREIETALQANDWKIYHMWLKSIARSTISYWNNKTDSSIYEKLFYNLLEKYKLTFTWTWVDLWIPTIALDSTLVTLSLKLCDRAKYRKSKWWVRVHIGLDLDQCFPRFAVITDGKWVDNKIAQQIVQEWNFLSWEMIVFDRYYVDFSLWKMIDEKWAFFVTRTKSNTDFCLNTDHIITEQWITKDMTIDLVWSKASIYWKELRIVRFYHEKDDREYEYITNNFDFSAGQIADIYKNRRKIEIFFKWMKQNLVIKSFLWCSENAVKNQIRIAMIYYLLVRYLAESAKLSKKQLLKFTRLIAEKCLSSIVITELYVICRSKRSLCISQNSPPIGGLFS
jgi:hypothetical protein